MYRFSRPLLVNMATPISLADVRRVVNDAVSGSLGTVGGLKLDKYDGEISWRCVEWMEDYEELTKIKGWTDQNRLDRFGGSLEKDAKNWHKLYIQKANPALTDWNTVKDLFLRYHLPKDKDSYAREQMLNRKQKPYEDVNKYMTHKHLLCLEVDPSMPFDEMKRHIIEGLLPQIKVVMRTPKLN